MAKRSIFARMSQLVRANVNTMIDKAEDPQKMLDQMVRDFTNNISEAESAAAEVIGNLRMMEQDREKHLEDSQDWGNKALAASSKADEFRRNGKSVEADKFDDLARTALERQMSSENSAHSLTPTIDLQRNQKSQLVNGLDQMRTKRGQLVTKRDELMARTRAAEMNARISEATRQISSVDPTSELSRMEENVRQLEARSRGQMELDSMSVESSFESLESLGEKSEIDARLLALKQQSAALLTDGKGSEDR